ncbi:hypothetical protein M141_3257 [Bacteroides fragilis str. S38L5]|uniref:Uncharacterized protein n=5 Tax=Bacteroides fragilis TaxID=817 RepID=A0A015VU85_BACFG|nr:hypothetical protein M101_3242 [Bacteroides fragilis str. 1007-1-F \
MVGRYVSGTSFIKHIPLKKTGRALIYYEDNLKTVKTL